MANLFPDAPAVTDEDQRLIDIYGRTGRTLDDLIYTQDFDRLYEQVQELGDARSPNEIAQRLFNLRKAALLPRLGRGFSSKVNISVEEENLLSDLIALSVGTVGQRDRLPYTEAFDQLAKEFNKRTERSLDHHQIWRLVSRIAK
jgi:hypothetical protein